MFENGEETTMEIGTVRIVDIEQEMKGAYLDYAMSVITARALPDVRDGLKPVQRRILYAMYDMGLRPERPYKKSARIVGEVLGKYHPHGDSAVYDAMVRMAQDFSMRYPLVDGQGNFGSIDGDSAAAMRYTEARLAPIAMEMLQDIDKNTVDFVDNFDGTLQEPAVLPAKLPNLLINGAAGIAVGMATNIPPHNLAEVCDALTYLIDRYDEVDEVTVDDLMKFIKGPDFPTGATILGTEGIRNAYVTGKGSIIMRARAHIEEIKGGRHRIVVTEIPYQVNKTTLLERIATLVREGRIDSISDMRDESDRHGMSIVIELKRGADPRTTLNQLLKYTQMQSTFGANMLALVDGQPRVLSLKKMLLLYLDHRQEVIRRRTEYELERARHRAHVLEGLLVALDNLDEVISTIRRSRSADTARKNLMRKFKLTEIQAQAILDMQLRRLAALERKKLQDEYAELIKQIAYYEDLLANPRKILYLVREDLQELREKYGDARRTRITDDGEDTEFTAEDLIPEEDVLVTITRRGYVKRVPASTYRTQRRGGRGIKGMKTRKADEVEHLFIANTLDSILFFTNRGRVFHLKAHQLPDAGRTAHGLPLSNLIPLDRNERVTAAVPVPDFQRADYLVMATRRGKIKRTALSEFQSVRPSGLIAILMEEGDELRWVRLTHGQDEIIITTERGQAIRFKEEEVRPMGRNAAGVNAIKLEDGDRVASMDVVRPGADLLVITTKGYGKRTPIAEYSLQSRYGKGIRTIDVRKLDEIGTIAAARVVLPEDEITLISAEGIVMRTPVRHIPQMGRATRGSLVMRLNDGDSVASIARLTADEEAPPPPPPKPAKKKRSTKRKVTARKKGTKKATTKKRTAKKTKKAAKK
jgi:DNA gyrase subunit A